MQFNFFYSAVKHLDLFLKNFQDIFAGIFKSFISPLLLVVYPNWKSVCVHVSEWIVGFTMNFNLQINQIYPHKVFINLSNINRIFITIQMAIIISYKEHKIISQCQPRTHQILLIWCCNCLTCWQTLIQIG